MTSDNGVLRLTIGPSNSGRSTPAGISSGSATQLAIRLGVTDTSTSVPRGQRALTDAEEADVPDALSNGDPSEKLAKFQSIPVTRESMWTLQETMR